MCNCQSNGSTVIIQTNYGDIEVKLYDETPIHKENFIKKVTEGHFDGLEFHRVINEFMIQGGGSGNGDKTRDTIAAEFLFPKYYHKRGALAAARWGDDTNPTKASDATQFYIVTGKTFTDEKLSEFEKLRFERLKQSLFNKIQSENIDILKALYKEGNREAMGALRESWKQEADREAEGKKQNLLYSKEQREIYKTNGGTPHLDGEYTVFGEVIKGMDVVDKIQKVETNAQDKPLKEVKMKIFIKK